MAADSMAKATIHEPVGSKDLWHHKGWQLPAYIQHVANDLREKGRDESSAIRLAVGVVRNWSEGHDGKGHRVSATTQAAATKAMAEWEALKARAAASHALTASPSKRTVDLGQYISAGLVDLAADPVSATTDGPSLTIPAAGGHRYHHGWIRIDTSAPTAVERATRAVTTDGHALLHGAGMVPAAQRVMERVKAAGHTPTVKRIDVAGTPHLHIARQRNADYTAAPVATVDLAFTEQLHPRAPKGTAGGGRFAPKNSASGPPSNMAANVRDFQRRTGLPVTGVIDPTTAAKIRAELTAKGGGGRKGSGKTKARKAAAAAKRQAKATTRAQKQQTATHVATVNAMTPTQRAAARAQMPVPPTGYVWTTPANTLRRFHA